MAATYPLKSPMELTFITDLGHSFVIEIDPNMELENVMALLEAEVHFVSVDSPGNNLTTSLLPPSLVYP